MYSLLLQDWVTLNGQASTSIAQAEANWLYCPDIQDLVFWLDLRNVSGTVTLNYETAPAKEESLFLPMVAGVSLTTPSATVSLTTAISAFALLPPAAWVRWRLVGGTAFNVSFRVQVTGNRVGAVGKARAGTAPTTSAPNSIAMYVGGGAVVSAAEAARMAATASSRTKGIVPGDVLQK